MAKKGGIPHFIETERSKGKSDKQITHMLLDAGWHMDIIQHALNVEASTAKTQKPASIKRKNTFKISRNLLKKPVFIFCLLAFLILVSLFI